MFILYFVKTMKTIRLFAKQIIRRYDTLLLI